MSDSSHLQHMQELYGSPESIEYYSKESFLLRGERLAFAACFPDGLRERRVLDLGCGGGRTTRFLHDMGARVTGVDISEALIRAARQRAPHIDFRTGDARALAFEDASFDAVVFAYNGIDHLYPKGERMRGIREIRRVLRAEGRFIFSSHSFAGFFLGWYTRRDWKFRIHHTLKGSPFQSETYVRDLDGPGVFTYFAWPRKVIADVTGAGFRLLDLFPNMLAGQILRRGLRMNAFTKLDKWPYYMFAREEQAHVHHADAFRATIRM